MVSDVSSHEHNSFLKLYIKNFLEKENSSTSKIYIANQHINIEINKIKKCLYFLFINKNIKKENN